MSAIISRVFGFLGIGFGGEEPDLKEKITTAIIRLETLVDRVRELRFRFESRDKELMSKIVEMVKTGNTRRASLYAGELAQVRNILKLIRALELMIEMVKERLHTVRDTQELVRLLLSFGTAVEELKEEAQGLYPGLVYAFDEVSRSARTLLAETSLDGVPDVDPIAVSSDASMILNYALKEAEKQIRESFPEAPVEPALKVVQTPTPRSKTPTGKASEKTWSGQARAAARASTSGGRRYSSEELEKLVLDYIHEHGGFLDLADFTRKYGVTREQVFKALKRLAEKGLISLT